jgi:predicted acetyltransferase
MMARLHEDGRERGEPLAGLFASESGIYGRFGYGPSAYWGTVKLPRDRSRLRVPRPRHGSIELVDLETALAAFEGVHASVAHNNGMLSRPSRMVRATWQGWLANARTPRQLALHRDPAGGADGVLLYEVDSFEAEGDWLLKATVHLRELWAANPTAELELWRFALDVDLTSDVRASHQRLDHPVRDLLADPRYWQTTTIDALHLRIQDVDRCLAARRYQVDDILHLEVIHPDGRTTGHRLEGGPHGATCEPYAGLPDFSLDLASLGSIYLGDAAVERLWRAGLVAEQNPGAVRRATTMFSWAPRPWPGYLF